MIDNFKLRRRSPMEYFVLEEYDFTGKSVGHLGYLRFEIPGVINWYKANSNFGWDVVDSLEFVALETIYNKQMEDENN